MMGKHQRNAVLSALKAVQLLSHFFEDQTPKTEPQRRSFNKRLDALNLVEDCLREALGVPPDMTRDEVSALTDTTAKELSPKD